MRAFRCVVGTVVLQLVATSYATYQMQPLSKNNLKAVIECDVNVTRSFFMPQYTAVCQVFHSTDLAQEQAARELVHDVDLFRAMVSGKGGNHHSLVATENERVAGAVVWEEKGKTATVEVLLVDEYVHEKAVVTALLDTIQSTRPHLKEVFIKPLCVHNHMALDLYKHLGFTPIPYDDAGATFMGLKQAPLFTKLVKKCP